MRITILLIAVSALACAADADLARRRPGSQSRWASFENPSAAPASGGKENRGAKGHAFDSIRPGETKTLLDLRGSGEVRRIWLTVRDRSPEMLRALRLEAFWDGAAEPAVSVPLGDFFGAVLGRPVPFENELFANPEGRSFNCYIPMPFRSAARITVTNDSEKALSHIFYDVNVLLRPKPDPELLYFHATWRRERRTELGRDFELLPRVKGDGRFLGVHVGVVTNPENIGWWGEGEVKMYLDGDRGLPTLIGTGTEDYIGTGWGQGTYHQRFQGCLVADAEKGQYTFYRYHVPDPVYFRQDARVTIQVMGGAEKSKIVAAMRKGVALQPVSIDDQGTFYKLLEQPGPVDLAAHPAGENAWVNVYRRDDFSAVALFYLDRPVNGLPKSAPAERKP